MEGNLKNPRGRVDEQADCTVFSQKMNLLTHLYESSEHPQRQLRNRPSLRLYPLERNLDPAPTLIHLVVNDLLLMQPFERLLRLLRGHPSQLMSSAHGVVITPALALPLIRNASLPFPHSGGAIRSR